MSKKKPAKKSPPNDQPCDFKKTCDEILDNLYMEVEIVHGARIDAVHQRIDVLSERIAEVEASVHRVGPVRRILMALFRRR